MKKVLKIIGIVLGVLIVALAIIPYAFQSQIQDLVKRYMNENLNAKVEFSDVNLSFFRSFPQAHVNVYNLHIENIEPFANETFATAKSVAFNMSIKELFKNAEEEPIVINSVAIEQALVTLKIDAYGNENFDILKVQDSTSESSSFTYDIKEYTIDKSALTYIDETTDFILHVTELQHKGNARFTSELSELDTESEANVSMILDSVNYLDNHSVRLEALIEMDIENQKYTFKENTGYINQLPLEFEGYVQQLENGQDIDISFKNPESSFKSFLAIIPEAYSKNFDDVETSGDFVMQGQLKGINSEDRIPAIDIRINSGNASFKYPNLPKAVSNIDIDMQVLNTSGNVDDTRINIDKFNFKIDNDTFISSAVLTELNENMKVSANIDGTINLANISKAYPIELEQELSGIMTGNIVTNFDMQSIETNNYQNIRSNGDVQLRNMVFSTEAMPHPIQISNADLQLNNGDVAVRNFKAITGSSDLSASGTLNNLVGFVLSNSGLQGKFNVTSNTLVVNDFISQNAEEKSSSATAIKSSGKTETVRIPDFLNCTINVNAKKVLYDDLTLNDLQGAVIVKDQQASLENITSSIFDGILALRGYVSTQSDSPTFNIDIGADSFNISKSFRELDLLQQLAPIADVLNGKLNTTINLSGTLNEELSPNLNSIRGNAFAQLLASAISPETSEVLQELGGALSFIDFSKLDVRDIQTNLDFADGLVKVKPFSFSYEDIEIIVSGSHSFDNTMNYSATFNVPAKYLGSEVNRLIGKINDPDVNKITIPVSAIITGTFSNPKVTTDLSSSVSNLTKQLIEIEKQKLLNSGKGKLLEILGGLPQPKTPETGQQIDSTTSDTTATKTEVPVGISRNDSVSATQSIKKGVKDILGGLIKDRKNTPKKTETDSIIKKDTLTTSGSNNLN